MNANARKAVTHTRHSYNIFKTLSTRPSSNSSKTSSLWRIKAQQNQLISQISTILLQRKNWQYLLKTHNLSSKLSPPIFLQILQKTQEHPKISLDFFNWANTNLVNFQPDLEIQCKIFQILVGSGETRPIKPILDSITGSNLPTHVLFSVIQACEGTNLHSYAFSSIIEYYAQKGFYFYGIQVYKNAVLYGYLPKISCLNALLDVLDNVGEFRLAYCLYGSMIRNGIVLNLSTWIVIARIFCKNGKFENVVRLLNSGVSNVAIFDLVIDGFSRMGNFEVAIDYVNEMCKRNIKPGFCTYGSILDGACEFSDENVVDAIMCKMKEKKLLPENLSFGYDGVIKKFCDMGKSYAAELLFQRARDEGVGLKDVTFGYMLGAFCNGGRVDEAIELYQIISKEKVFIKKSYYDVLAESLCKATPSENANQLLRRLIMKGFILSVSEISKYMIKLCREDNWKDVEALLSVMFGVNILPDSLCCRLLVDHYCSSGQIDSALLLHQNSEKSKTLWDVTTYNILLRTLLTEAEARVDEALNIFESMRRNNVVNKASFIVMISGLSQRKDMRKALQFHDDMLKLGLKPSSKTYKSLISVFR